MVVRTTPVGLQQPNTSPGVAFANNIAGGWIGYLPRTADQTGITTEVDVSGVSVACPVNANRRLLITGYTSGFTMSNTDTVAQLSIYEGGTQLGYARVPCAFASLSYNPAAVAMAVITNTTAQTRTFKLRASRIVGTGTVTIAADTDRACFILVHDIGPS